MSALGDSLRKIADLADAGIVGGRNHGLTAHLTTEEDVRTLAAILGGEVVEHKSHMNTVQVYVDAPVDEVRVTAMFRTERPWVEPREDDGTEALEGMGLDTSRTLNAEALAEIEYAERYEADDDGTEAESLAEVQAPVEIVADQYWIDKRFDREHRVWDVIDGMVEMNGPTGNAYTISPDDLRAGYTLKVTEPAPDMEWVLGDEGEPVGVREVSTDPVGALTGEPHPQKRIA